MLETFANATNKGRMIEIGLPEAKAKLEYRMMSPAKRLGISIKFLKIG